MKRKIIMVFILVILCFSSVSSVHADEIFEPQPVTPEQAGTDGFTIAFSCLFIFLFVLQIVARGLMLRKRGIDGWKIIIPFYGRCLEYQAYWKTKYFWINFAISAYMLLALIFIYNSENSLLNGIMAVLFMLCAAGYLIIVICLRRKSLVIFEYSRHLAFLELLGLGFILDFLCGFTFRKQVQNQKIQNQKSADISVLQEHLDNWE